jgi:serine/threonine-protein kinase HipA
MTRPSAGRASHSTSRPVANPTLAAKRPTSAQVWVEIEGQTIAAGQVYSHRHRGAESASFAYEPSYVSNTSAYPLDPALPLLLGTQQTPVGRSIFGAFSDSCPDRWGRRLIERAERRRAEAGHVTPRSLGEFDFLLGVRDDLRQGAIRYSTDAGFVADEATGVPAMTDLPRLLAAADDVDRETGDPQSLALLLRAGSSLGGARPKAHVRDQNGRVAIAKFPSPSDEWNVMAWEKTALDLAALAGITTPENHLEIVAGRSVLIVDRFDRTANGLRRGYMSAMTALEAIDGDVRSYLDIAAVLEEKSLEVTAELAQLWRRVAFYILISNTDDHLRNHALVQLRGDSWALSPAYDLNPSPSPGPKHLSTAIDRDTTADLRDLFEVAPLFRLDEVEALNILDQVQQAVRQWREVATRNGLSKTDAAAMAPAFEHAQSEIAAALVAGSLGPTRR